MQVPTNMYPLASLSYRRERRENVGRDEIGLACVGTVMERIGTSVRSFGERWSDGPRREQVP